MRPVTIVFSGGSVKGCFQVGAFKAIVEQGFYPERLYGTSVGSLNSTYISCMAAEAYEQNNHQPLTQQHWTAIAASLENYWRTNIKAPEDVAKKRKAVPLGWDILNNNFRGLSDTSPINDKIDSILNQYGNLLRTSSMPLELTVSSVDVKTGLPYFTKRSEPDFKSHLKGSMAIPLAMPPSKLNDMILFDGGVRIVAPIGQAINDGAKNIIAVCCQSEALYSNAEFNDGKVLALAERIQDIVVIENVTKDKKFAQVLNTIIAEAIAKGYYNNMASLSKYKLISHLLIQPAVQLMVNIADFTEQDIDFGITTGYNTTRAVIPGYNPV